jgi:hypothetical protein
LAEGHIHRGRLGAVGVTHGKRRFHRLPAIAEGRNPVAISQTSLALSLKKLKTPAPSENRKQKTPPQSEN